MSAPYVIKMPQLSDTMTEGVIVSWEKQLGDRIERGTVVATVETDKAIMDVEVFREGWLSGPLQPVDATVAVGEAIAYLAASEEEVSHEGEAAPADGEGRPSASEESDAEPTADTDAHEEPTQPREEVHAAAEVTDEPDGVTHIIKMPQLSDTMHEGVVVSWEKQPGDKIERGTVVATVETDKAVMDVEVFREGFLSGPLAAVDSTVEVGGALAYLVDDAGQVVSETAAAPAASKERGQAPARPAAPPTAARAGAGQSSSGRAAPLPDNVTPLPRPHNQPASPYARRLAAQLGVNLNNLRGSGPQGAITAADVENAQPAQRPAHVSDQPPPHTMPQVQVPGEGRAMSAMEKAVAHSMTASLTMPTFHVTVHAQPGRLIKAAKANGVSVTVAIAKACALAIGEHSNINWAYQPVDKLVEREQVDIGMAVAADGGGLVVPVLRQCESRSLGELNDDWKDLVERARKRRLSPDEYANPTFMVSNMGMLGVSHFDAIPTPGTAAILAISSAGAEGMPLTVTADHRVVNGADVAQFLNTLKQVIEDPEQWMGRIGPAIPEGDWDYDVVVIGGGPGGEDCARDLASHGLKVAMVNDAPFPGGECLWRGCIPSKAWRAAADRIRDRAHDGHLGISTSSKPKLDFAALEATRRKVLETRGGMALKTDKGLKIKVIQGYGRFESEHGIFIDTSANSDEPHRRQAAGDGSEGERLSFGAAVIAAGAPPFVPPIDGAHEGLESGAVLTSDSVWELEQPPKRLGVVGGGAIGMEMAQIFQDFGAKVTLLEARDRVLLEVEPEIAKQLTAVLEDEPNLTVETQAKIKKISGAPGKVKLAWQDVEGKERSFTCDRVLMATGKRPQLDGLQLDKAGVVTENGVIKVDAQCRTNVNHIYAVGDVIGGLMLAHTAGQQGRVAAAALTGEDLRYDQALDSGVIFTRPQAAFVGLSVEQAKQAGMEAVEVKVPINIDAKAMINDEQHGLIKLVVDKASQRIVGVHLLADHADTLVGEAVMMVSGRMTLEQVAHAIHPHPTQTELFGDLARRLLSRLRRSKPSSKAKATA